MILLYKVDGIVTDLIVTICGEEIVSTLWHSVNNKILGGSHEKGLLSLIHINTLTASDITAMLTSDDSIIRKYGVIAASKVYEKKTRDIIRFLENQRKKPKNHSKGVKRWRQI